MAPHLEVLALARDTTELYSSFFSVLYSAERLTTASVDLSRAQMRKNRFHADSQLPHCVD